MNILLIITNLFNYLFLYSLFTFLFPDAEGFMKLFFFSISSVALMLFSMVIDKKYKLPFAHYSTVLNIINAFVVPIMIIIVGFIFPN